jgi:hypothetical protein
MPFAGAWAKQASQQYIFLFWGRLLHCSALFSLPQAAFRARSFFLAACSAWISSRPRR